MAYELARLVKIRFNSEQRDALASFLAQDLVLVSLSLLFEVLH